MSDLEKLKFAVADDILGVARLFNEVTNSDLQGISEATAGQVVSKVARFIKDFDYDLEDLV